MNQRLTTTTKRILAIDPIYRGFGFAVLEGPRRLVDWGVAGSADRDVSESVKRVVDLVERYGPDVVVTEKVEAVGGRRRMRARRLIALVEEVATANAAKVGRVPRLELLEEFPEMRPFSKDRVAAVIAARFPELRSSLPAVRRPWMSEDTRMAIFDAVAFGLAYLSRRERLRRDGQIAA